MKTHPELQAIQMSHGPCDADYQEAIPTLQVYASGEAAASRRHDHLLRAALLANGCTSSSKAVETH